LTKYKSLTKLTSINFRNKSTFIHCFSHLRRPFDHFVLPTFLRKMPLLENSILSLRCFGWNGGREKNYSFSCPALRLFMKCSLLCRFVDNS